MKMELKIQINEDLRRMVKIINALKLQIIQMEMIIRELRLNNAK